MATENTRDDVTRTLAEPRRTTFRIFYGRLRSGVIILPMRITAQAYYLFQFPGLAFAVSQRLSLFHVVSFQVSQFLYALISRHGWNHIRILCYAKYLIFLPKSNWNQLGNRKNEGLAVYLSENQYHVFCTVGNQLSLSSWLEPLAALTCQLKLIESRSELRGKINF